MALEEEFEYLCKTNMRDSLISGNILAFRCAYCNCYNKSRKQKPVFHGDIAAHDHPSANVNQGQTQLSTERMEISSSDSSDSIRGKLFIHSTLMSFIRYVDQETNIIHRSIPVSASPTTPESRSRSTSAENRRRDSHPNLSSSEESLNKKSD